MKTRHDPIIRSLRRNGTSTIDELAQEVGAAAAFSLIRNPCRQLRAFLACLHIAQLSPLHDPSDMARWTPSYCRHSKRHFCNDN